MIFYLKKRCQKTWKSNENKDTGTYYFKIANEINNNFIVCLKINNLYLEYEGNYNFSFDSTGYGDKIMLFTLSESINEFKLKVEISEYIEKIYFEFNSSIHKHNKKILILIKLKLRK